MKIYVAAHCRWAALHVASVLSASGHEIVSRWVDSDFKPTDQHVEPERSVIAQEDFDDVAAADALVLIAGPDRYSGGKFVETGIALGMGKRVVVIGRRENMLIWLPAIQQVDDPQSAAELLAQSDFDARIRSAIERKAEPVGYVSKYGLDEVAEGRMAHIAPAGTFRPENEIPLFSTPPAAPVQPEYGYMRVVEVFDRNETAGAFLSEDGEGGFAAGVSRMADEIDRLRAALSGGNAVPQTLDEIIENSLRMWYFNYDPSLDHTAARIAMREIIRYVIDVARVSPASPSPAGDRDALIERLREENADLRSELYRRGQEADDTWLTERERAW